MSTSCATARSGRCARGQGERRRSLRELLCRPDRRGARARLHDRAEPDLDVLTTEVRDGDETRRSRLDRAAAWARPARLHAHPVPETAVPSRSTARRYRPLRLRGADALRPRRVAAAVRGGREPDRGDRNGEHVRGELPVRARRRGRHVVDENFVTATSGTGTRGTFEFTSRRRAIRRRRERSSSSRAPPRTARG